MILPDLKTANAYFCQNYQMARQAWLNKVAHCTPLLSDLGWAYSESGSYPHALTGQTGEPLASDWLWLGDLNAKQVGVVVSATHGIEGYVGNAVQVFLLDFLLSQSVIPNNDIALLFIHALNPWGMAWLRRCDEDGVDLNRNYIDFANPPNNPGYLSLQASLEIADPVSRQQALQTIATRLGATDYAIALSGGQYVDAKGPFYGGQQPAHGHRVNVEMVEKFQLSQRDTVVLDIHSGLGAWSHGELISDHPLNGANDKYAQQVFGPGVTNPARGDSSSVAKYGLQDYFWHKQMGDRGCYLTLEYGTYPIDNLFNVIVDDHRLWRSTALQNVELVQQQFAMLEHFCPHDVYWRQLVLIQAAQVCERLLTGFQST